MNERWMTMIFALLTLALTACGTPGEKDGTSNGTNGGTAKGCMEEGPDGNRLNVCTLRSPIQETGFLCPQGTPYLHEFDGAAVCSENPSLTDEQRERLEDDGLENCDDLPTSAFCQPAEPSDERQEDCDTIVGSFDCLDDAERQALQDACEAAAIAASPEDWSDLNSCMDISNSGTGPNNSLCPDKSACVGRVLRVCHEYNDECWDIREGRAGTCDNLEGELEVCTTAAERDPLVAACEVAVKQSGDDAFQELEECFTMNLNSFPGNPDHPYCETVRTCADNLLLPDDPPTCTPEELALTLLNETDDPDLDTSGFFCVAENTADNCTGTTFEERCGCLEDRFATEYPGTYDNECGGGAGFRCQEQESEIVALHCAIKG